MELPSFSRNTVSGALWSSEIVHNNQRSHVIDHHWPTGQTGQCELVSYWRVNYWPLLTGQLLTFIDRSTIDLYWQVNYWPLLTGQLLTFIDRSTMTGPTNTALYYHWTSVWHFFNNYFFVLYSLDRKIWGFFIYWDISLGVIVCSQFREICRCAFAVVRRTSFWQCHSLSQCWILAPPSIRDSTRLAQNSLCWYPCIVCRYIILFEVLQYVIGACELLWAW
jgi:hypothetical protein